MLCEVFSNKMLKRNIFPSIVLCWFFVELYFAAANAKVQEGDSCTLKNTNVGICKKLKNCPQILSDPNQLSSLVTCGFIGHEAVVCCPDKNIAVPSSTHSSASTKRPQPSRSTMPAVKSTTYKYTSVPASSNATTMKTTTVPKETSNATMLSKSLQMCKKYAESAYTEVLESAQLIGEESTKKKILDCKGGSTLIVGGTKAEAREFPHMAHIGYGEVKQSSDWICGGSLISEKYVLTAAHCTETLLGPAKWVRLGDLDIESDIDDAKPEVFEVKNRIRHPQYNKPQLYNDIGLLELGRNVTFNSYIRPLCLNTDSNAMFQNAVATGWGRVENDGLRSQDLLKVTLNIVTTAYCNMSFYNHIGQRLPIGINGHTMICAGELEGGKDTCQGDSGGPFQIKSTVYRCMYDQIGVTSFGRRCAAPDSPAVYTRVSSYIPWIENIVWP